MFLTGTKIDNKLLKMRSVEDEGKGALSRERTWSLGPETNQLIPDIPANHNLLMRASFRFKNKSTKRFLTTINDSIPWKCPIRFPLKFAHQQNINPIQRAHVAMTLNCFSRQFNILAKWTMTLGPAVWPKTGHYANKLALIHCLATRQVSSSISAQLRLPPN